GRVPCLWALALVGLAENCVFYRQTQAVQMKVRLVSGVGRRTPMIIEIAREIHGNSLFAPLTLRSLIPELDPIMYTSIAAPLGINSSVSKSTLKKKNSSSVIQDSPSSNISDLSGT